MPRTDGDGPLAGVPTRTTAPRRNPGAAGVNVTAAVQVAPCASVADAQFAMPVPAAKSPDGEPSVRISTLVTVPAVDAVTVTA